MQPTFTTRPDIRGTFGAVATTHWLATQTGMAVLERGGNAFDAAVASQAVLGLVDAASNGVGSDAVILLWDAKAKQVVSINAEGTAPQLATIEWYKKNLNNTLPQSDTLLSGTVPGVVDAWYLLLDRWGTMTFAQVLQPAIEMAENGFPIGERMAGAIASSRKLKKYATSVKVYFPNGAAPKPGDMFRNPDLARTLRKLVDAEKESAGKGRHEALKAARVASGFIDAAACVRPRITGRIVADRVSSWSCPERWAVPMTTRMRRTPRRT